MNTIKEMLKNPLFLLNDPDPMLLRVMRNKFKKDAGWDAIIATDYEEALRAYKDAKPNVVLTEILLNDTMGKTGFDFITQIRKEDLNHETKIMVLSELGQQEDIEKAKNAGANKYFVKSQITINDMINDIGNFLVEETA